MRVSTKAATLDLGATGASSALDICYLNGYAIVVSWPATGTPVGTLTLEGTNDAWDEEKKISGVDTEYSGATWVTISGSSTSVSGSAGSYAWNAADQNFQAVRIKYTRTSGTGTLTFNFRGKSVQ